MNVIIMKRIKIGDIFEISTNKGKGYLHYVYDDKILGQLIRVLPGLFEESKNEFRELVLQKELFVVFFPLKYALKKAIISQVGSEIIDFEKPKLMRSKHLIGDKFHGWHIVNTDSFLRHLVKNLNEEQRQYSPFGLWNDTLLIGRMEEGWTLENWK